MNKKRRKHYGHSKNGSTHSNPKREGFATTQALLQTFVCKRNPDIQRFLQKSAVRFDSASLSRTYLILNEMAQSRVGGRAVILECENNPKLISLYEQHGFRLVETLSDKHQLKTLLMIPTFH